MSADDLVTRFKEYFAMLSDEQRVDLLSEITYGYCRDCGRKLEPFEVCQCENDE